MGLRSPPGRRGPQGDAPRATTHPTGCGASPEAAFPWPLAVLRPACGARRHGANRAWRANQGKRSN